MSKRKEAQRLSLTPIIISLVVFLVFVQLMISHRLATRGEQLRQLEIKAKQLEQENLILAEEINQAGSLSRITQEARNLGFARANQILHLHPQIPVALGKSDLPLGR